MTSEHAALLLLRAKKGAAISQRGNDSSPLHLVANRHEAKFEVAVLYAFSKARKAVGTGKPKVNASVNALKTALRASLPKIILKTYIEGGEVGLSLLPKPRTAEMRDAADEARLTIKFDAKNPRVIKWAREHAAELVTQVSDTTRERLRKAVTKIEQGKLKVGREEILDAIGDKKRANTIARHESMLATNEGQREGWRQARDAELLNAKAKRTWITTYDELTCTICAPLEGAVATLDGGYPGGHDGPPAHVRCRCTEGIA